MNLVTVTPCLRALASMSTIAELAERREEVEAELNEAVRSACQARRSWSEIGTMLGVAKQAAQRKYDSKVTAQ